LIFGLPPLQISLAGYSRKLCPIMFGSGRLAGFAALLQIVYLQLSVLHGQTLVNGDFELPGVGTQQTTGAGNADILNYESTVNKSDQEGRQYAVDLVILPPGSEFMPGWPVGGSGVIYNVSSLGLVRNTSGHYHVRLWTYRLSENYRGGAIAQDIKDLAIGQQYYVFFDLYQSQITPVFTVTVNIGSNSTAVLNSAAGRWETHTVPFVATSAIMNLKFSAPDHTSPEIGIDRIRVASVSNAPIALAVKEQLGIKVEGLVGSTYRVEYSESVNTNQWAYLTRVTLTASPTWVYDQLSPQDSHRFYRSVQE
jgi:hypothetical protein